MVEYIASKAGVEFVIEGKYHNELDIEGFSRMMKDPSYCYKFYWLEAIVQLISENRTEATYDEIINEMIVNAWYSVLEFNPEVPGLIYKLAPLDEKMRKLTHVRKLWNGILDLREINDVFTGNPINENNYDVDHFIPWSFVMNDELWNLMPMDSSLNSSKSNHLPKWEEFFYKFADNQFIMYQMVHDKEGIRKLYEACYRDNLHSIWANRELYRKGNTKEQFYNILEVNMRPVYDSARRQGYDVWDRKVV